MSDWTHVGDSLGIHNLCLYDKLNLPLRENSLFACCQYGGPLAIGLAYTTPNSWAIGIYMQNGAQIASIEASGVYRLFWSKCQKLIIVSSNGRVLVYNALGVHLVAFNMGDETLAVGLAEAAAFCYVNETGEQSSALAYSKSSKRVHPIAQLLDRSDKRREADEASIHPCNFVWARRDGSYLRMEPDAKHSQLALLHDTFVLQIVDCADLEVELRNVRLDHGADVVVGPLAWCGANAVCLKSGGDGTNELALYALANDEAKENVANAIGANEAVAAPNFTFSFPAARNSPVFLSSAEFDCVRVFSRFSAHLLLPVSASTNAVLGLTSNEPGSLLFDAERKMEQKSHQAYEYVRSISAQQMPEAVDQCLEAAADHFDPKVQKQLLRAASIGIRRCDRPYDPDRFVHICRVLRVLNALRPMGIPLTHQQLNELSLPSVIDRLASLNHWPLSIKLCNFLNLPPKNGVFKVLGHWCLAMMERYKERQRNLAMAAEERHAQTEEGLAQRMVAKLAEYPTISYADIAEMASRQDLPTLASILLELEPDTTRQVTVMLKLKQLDKALHKAAHSQRPDLLLLVIRHLRNTLTSRDMELLLRKVPQALSIYQSEIRDEAPERLLALYEQNDDFVRQAIFHLGRAEQNQAEDFFDSSKVVEQLGRAEKALRQMREPTNAQLVAESAQLIVDNTKREEKHNTPMVHLTVRESFLWAAAREEMALMEQLRKQHRLNDKQVFLWTAEGFARGGKWQQFEQYVKSKKSPLGYLPVIRLCASHGNKNLAFRLMDRVNVYEEQVQAYLILGVLKKAATLAAEKEDVQMLQNIKCRFPPSSANWDEVKKIMDTLLKKAT
uniref:Vacuolar protein sorting-associated protein 16 homolog n=1 Tax=Globodera rostochiensis TaxID=31243 RepID=A0A914I6H5_GLORO